jgi:C-terminal processing protease CtpA/Prc
MKKILLLFTILITLSSFAQIKSIETDKLAITGKIWGFLKYYHPEVGKGKFNWDNQLAEILPKITKTKNKEELSNIYLEWINSLGEIQICKECTSKENKDFFGKNFDLAWIKDSTFFSKELITKLNFIEKNRFQGEHHYISSFKGGGNVIIQNETEYPNFSWENKQLRLLSIFRYWNYIEYFFPYKYQMDKDWDIVLNKSIPKFLYPKTETDYHLAMLELIVNINDTHGYFDSNLINNHFGSKWIPTKYKIIDNKAVITGFYDENLAKENDLKIGDVILKVNGVLIETILNKKDKYIYGSNISAKMKNVYNKIFNGSNNSLTITYERNNKIKEKKIKRYSYFNQSIHQKTVNEKWKILDNNIGYINMALLEIDDVKLTMDSLSKTKAIIFDIRNYPKGTMYSISEYLNKSPQEFAKITVPDLTYPGKFNWTQTISCGRKNTKVYSGKVILLVNEITQSYAEFTTMCFQTAEKAIIIGSQTSGADGDVSKINLVGGFKTRFTGVGVFYPNGKETQRIGIVPDIEIKQTIEGIKIGKDEVLEKAIQVASE